MDCPYLPPLRTTCSTNDDSSAFYNSRHSIRLGFSLGLIFCLASLFHYIFVLVSVPFSVTGYGTNNIFYKSDQGCLMLDAFRIKCGIVSCFAQTGNPPESFRWNSVADMKTRTLLHSNHGLVKLQLFVKAFSFYNCFLLHPFFFLFLRKMRCWRLSCIMSLT